MLQGPLSLERKSTEARNFPSKLKINEISLSGKAIAELLLTFVPQQGTKPM